MTLSITLEGRVIDKTRIANLPIRDLAEYKISLYKKPVTMDVSDRKYVSVSFGSYGRYADTFNGNAPAAHLLDKLEELSKSCDPATGELVF